MEILYIYFGIIILLFLIFFLKELFFFVRSTLVEGEVLYSSIKVTYRNNYDDDGYGKDEKTVHAKVAFVSNEGEERISNINFIGKKELKMGDKINIRYLRSNPNVAKVSKIKGLFYWSICFAINLFISTIILMVVW